MTRNFINTEEIKIRIDTLSGRIRSPLHVVWFKSQLWKYLLNRYESDTFVISVSPEQILNDTQPYPEWVYKKAKEGQTLHVFRISATLSRSIVEVIDYLNSECDFEIRVRMRWEEAVQYSDQWHTLLAKMDDDESLGKLEKVKLWHEVSNGYRWVELKNEAALTYEGKRMGHCVGSYWYEVTNHQCTILSLRDAKNQPHVTIEIDNDISAISQIQGKANTIPFKYRNYIAELFNIETGLMYQSTVNLGDIFIHEDNTKEEPVYRPYTMDEIKNHAHMACHYSTHIMKERWYEAEEVIASEADTSTSYFHNHFQYGERWEPIEQHYLSDATAATAYALSYIKGRWPEAEPIIATNPNASFEYAYDVLCGRFPAGEDIIKANVLTHTKYNTWVLNKACPILEQQILEWRPIDKENMWATETMEVAFFRYFTRVKKGDWPEYKQVMTRLFERTNYVAHDSMTRYLEWNYGERLPHIEPALLSSSNMALVYHYAMFNIGGRWPEFEEMQEECQFSNIDNDSMSFIRYIRDVRKERWPTYEKYLLKAESSFTIFEYMKEVVREEWPEALEVLPDVVKDRYLKTLSDISEDFIPNHNRPRWMDDVDKEKKHLGILVDKIAA